MNKESFERMDREFLDSLKNVREQKIPEGIRRNFKRSVEERILASGRPVSFGLSFLLTPALILVLGAALCWFYLRPNLPVQKNIPAEAELQKKETVSPIIAAAAPVPAPVVQQNIVRSAVQIESQPVAKLPVVSQITESNIITELEVLKELGVWTEKDEEEIGITAEQIFEELETLAGELLSGGNTGNIPQTSTQ